MNAVLPNRTINQLDHSGKIKAQHLNRKAIIYIRQSTLQQVQRHQESTRLQYGLVDKAILLGWPRCDIEVIDDDLGCSGSTMAGRQGFQRLVLKWALIMSAWFWVWRCLDFPDHHETGINYWKSAPFSVHLSVIWRYL